ncbi:class I adenylate-forming enzyme family protein [Actinosynnema sp. NPDC047251]|uniref:AMP-dependent synthetase and ligase n=1 Tax=Saccharothrix espanaensis (strain ATCC 51144 / DSM 44229 / JCM 9112 / NBRC 15066 / NRRL 15764) TaxID=1179773 RepID=K0JY36_SACES|nr:class I adenylate-forming enzyme family protein [Saccharothrix espanaensis]CCH31051.1 AMP-dependent synthetase and ligase [Saccharothrix espanaensis DSM 44229]
MTWRSANGVELRDLVPEATRRGWVAAGHCPDLDLCSLWRDRVARHPRRTAVVDERGALDYASLDAEVRRLAGALHGFGPADIIGVRVPNGRDAVIAELAVAAVGAVALPFAGGLADAVSLLARSRASALITDSPGPEGLPHLRKVLPVSARGPVWRPVPVDPEAPARILVSSGPRAEPTMVAYSHNAVAGGRGNHLRAVHRGTAVWRDLVLVPLSSAFGSFGAAVTLCRFGGTVLLMRRFDALSALRVVARQRPTHVFGAPGMLARMAAAASTVDTSSLRAVVAGGDVLPPPVLRACRVAFGVDVVDVYGSPEGVDCHTTTPEHGAGRPDPAVADIRVVDGEICGLGPMTPLCHVGVPSPRLPGGWVRTGDQGRFDASGVLHVERRLARVVIRGGYPISPAEVEQALGAHPGVSEVACVPVPDRELGERLCACVSPKPGHPAPDLPQLTAFLADRQGVTRHKLPEFLLVLPDFPVGPTGKVCLRTLARLAAERHGGTR